MCMYELEVCTGQSMEARPPISRAGARLQPTIHFRQLRRPGSARPDANFHMPAEARSIFAQYE